MIPTWEVTERTVYGDNEGADVPVGTETVHFLNLAKGNRRVFCNIQITFAYRDELFTNSDVWHICLMSEFCETFKGTLDEAKAKALTYLPRVIDEAKKVIATYEEMTCGTS